MFLTIIAILAFILLAVSMLCMGTIYKAFMFFYSFVNCCLPAFFLFINYPLSSALAICSVAAGFALSLKINFHLL